MLEALLTAGADPNARSGDDFVPLGHAVHHENQPLEVCRVLMSLGACPFALCRGDSGIAIVDVATWKRSPCHCVLLARSATV